MVYASNKYFCPNVYVLAISASYIHHNVNMLSICTLILSFLPLYLESRPMMSHHVIYHVTAVICLFIIKEKSKEKNR